MLFTQSEYLTILSHAPADAVKLQAEAVLDNIGPINVLVNRTGLVMLPYTDNAQGTVFHLGEVLVAEAHIRIESGPGAGTEGYGMCAGRDLVQALGIAVIDATLMAGLGGEALDQFLLELAQAQAAADDHLLRAVEQTRVEMQTF